MSHGPAEGAAPDVSIIVTNYNTRDLLRACFTSMEGRLGRPWLEVIVVDNASVDGSAEMTRAEFPDVRVIVQERNEGFAHANNRGIRESRGRHVLILNSDTRSEERRGG